MILYHGTVIKRSQDILKNGFNLSCSGIKSGYPMAREIGEEEFEVLIFNTEKIEFILENKRPFARV